MESAQSDAKRGRAGTPTAPQRQRGEPEVGRSSCGGRARRDAGWNAAWILGVALLALPGVAPAEIVVPGLQATFRWNPASGPVNGYEVWVARNGGPAAALTWVGATEITLTGAVGEVTQISVRAFSMPDGPNAPFVWGPLSAASEPIRFEIPTPEAFAVLDCPSCSRSDLRVLPGDTATLSVAHPPGGPWDLVHVGKFAAGGAIQIALQQRTSGELFIGDYVGTNALVPRANHLEPGFERSLASAADFDGDGFEEILMWDGSTGRLTFWGIQDGYLVRLASFATVDPTWSLIGTQDLNRDGNADLWFDNHNGKVWVYFTYHLLSTGAIRFPMSLTGYTMQDVADYDGNGMPDVLLRKATGKLTLGLLRGDPNAPTVAFQTLPLLTGDDLLVPQVSVDLDDLPGAEILLQTSSSGSGRVDAVFPASADPAQRQRLLTTEAGSALVQVVR